MAIPSESKIVNIYHTDPEEEQLEQIDEITPNDRVPVVDAETNDIKNASVSQITKGLDTNELVVKLQGVQIYDENKTITISKDTKIQINGGRTITIASGAPASGVGTKLCVMAKDAAGTVICQDGGNNYTIPAGKYIELIYTIGGWTFYSQMVSLTLAEYEALGDSVNSDNIVYAITDDEDSMGSNPTLESLNVGTTIVCNGIISSRTGIEVEGTLSVNRKNNTKVGENSTTEGFDNTASGVYSHAEGFNTIADDIAMHAAGQFNKTTTGVARVTGWGESNAKKDIEVLDTNGNLKITGDVYVNLNENGQADKLAKESMVNNALANEKKTNYNALSDANDAYVEDSYTHYAVVAPTTANLPITNGTFILESFSTNNSLSSNKYGYQKATGISSTEGVYIRTRKFDKSWNDWKKLTTETDISNALTNYQKTKNYNTSENFANLYKAIISDWSNIEIGTTIANVSSSSGAKSSYIIFKMLATFGSIKEYSPYYADLGIREMKLYNGTWTMVKLTGTTSSITV